MNVLHIELLELRRAKHAEVTGDPEINPALPGKDACELGVMERLIVELVSIPHQE
jgi:hypothetical protein